MLQPAAGLNPRALRAIAELERQVVDADGGRLKLEWDTLRARGGDRVDDLLWWEDDQLVGFLGIYAFGGPPELAGMVAPAARRRRVGSALLDTAVRLCRERDDRPPLLVVPRGSTAGRQLALRRGAALDHSEHHLVLTGEPARAPESAQVAVRPATDADLPLIIRLLERGFDDRAPSDLADRLDSPRGRTVVIESNHAVVGTMFLARDGTAGSIYGFAVSAPLRGRGIGRAALRQACAQLWAGGARRITLEVDVTNDRALGLYTSVGFERLTTEDYYALPAPDGPRVPE